MEEDEHEIVLHNDGTWDPLTSHKEENKSRNSRKPLPSSSRSTRYDRVTETLLVILLHSRGKKRPSSDVDCITLEESSDNLELLGRSKKSKAIVEIECIDID